MRPRPLRPLRRRPGPLVAAALLLLACGSRSHDEARTASSESASRDSAPAASRPAPPPEPPAATMPDTPPPGAPPPGRGSGDTAASPASPPPAAADTLRGTVAVVGSTPMTRVVLVTPDGVEHRIEGPAAGALRRAADLEVVVRGTRHARAVRAESFVVRAASGRPAHDGVLTRDGDRWSLRPADGEPLGLAEVPPSLGQAVGRRVWVVVGEGGEVVSFGRLE